MAKRILTITTCLFLINLWSLAEETKELSSVDFLKKARHPQGRECWMTYDGFAIHERRGKDGEITTIKAPLYLGVIFTPERTTAQVVIDDKEGYLVGQAYRVSKDATSIEILHRQDGKNKKSRLADFGLRPQDLTMSFLYWTFRKELPRDSTKGRSCRVFLLESPEKKELVKVYLDARQFFPLKVQWIKAGTKDQVPYHTLEAKSFREGDNNFWFITTLRLTGEGWRTTIKFPKTAAGYTQEMIPKTLFKQFPEKKP